MISISSVNKTPNLKLTQYGTGDHLDPMIDYTNDMKAIDDFVATCITSTKGIAPDSNKLHGKDWSSYPTIDDPIIWKPSLIGTVTIGNPTYVQRVGTAYKIGKLCYINCIVEISDKGGMDGFLEIDGVPLPIVIDSHIDIVKCSGIESLSGTISPYAEANNTKVFLGQTISNYGTNLNVTADKIKDTFLIQLSGYYLTI